MSWTVRPTTTKDPIKGIAAQFVADYPWEILDPQGNQRMLIRRIGPSRSSFSKASEGAHEFGSSETEAHEFARKIAEMMNNEEIDTPGV